jgi:hypothetical protein
VHLDHRLSSRRGVEHHRLYYPPPVCAHDRGSTVFEFVEVGESVTSDGETRNDGEAWHG